MKKLICVLVMMLMASSVFAAAEWIRGDGSDSVKGTDNVSDVDYDITNYLQDPLDRTLFNIYKCTLTRTSATVITIGAGKIVCSNGAGTVHKMRENTSTTTVTMTNAGVGGIDSGSSEKASTWYDIYAVADADATTFTAIAAEQGVALSDATYYRYVGSAYNDSGSDLKNFYWYGWGHHPLIMWDVPVSITTTLSAGAWSGATSLATGIPSSSTCAILGLYAFEGAGSTNAIWVRPNGSTWTTSTTNAVNAVNAISGQRICMTDSSQQIQYYNHGSDSATEITVEGCYINR